MGDIVVGGGGGERFRWIRCSKYPLGGGNWRTVRNRNAFAIRGSGVPFPDVLSGNCCITQGILRTSKSISTVPRHHQLQYRKHSPNSATLFINSFFALLRLRELVGTPGRASPIANQPAPPSPCNTAPPPSKKIKKIPIHFYSPS